MSRRFDTAPAQLDRRHAARGASFAAPCERRYRQPDQACTVTVLADGGCAVETDDPQRAVTPGQSAVFYRR